MTARELHMRAIAPERFVVMGLRLLPLTIGHIETLGRYDADRFHDAASLGVAVLICSRSHRDADAFFNSRLFSLRMAIWRWRLGAWDFPAKRALFSQYIRYHTEVPELLFPPSATDKKSALPFTEHLKTVLCAKAGFDQATVEDTPYLRAMWSYLSAVEYEGLGTVMDKSAFDFDGFLTDEQIAKAIEASKKALNPC